MTKNKSSSTGAIRAFKDHGIEFVEHPYNYADKGGAQAAAKELGLDEHLVVKTLVMVDEKQAPLIVLMFGDREVSTKTLARLLGVKKITPCDAGTANRLTGYMVGGISPFGTRTSMPVYVESEILNLPKIYINAGKRGLLAEIDPGELVRVLNATPVEVAR